MQPRVESDATETALLRLIRYRQHSPHFRFRQLDIFQRVGLNELCGCFKTSPWLLAKQIVATWDEPELWTKKNISPDFPLAWGWVDHFGVNCSFVLLKEEELVRKRVWHDLKEKALTFKTTHMIWLKQPAEAELCYQPPSHFLYFKSSQYTYRREEENHRH